MIRPCAGFSAPSQSTLRYLRTLLFPRPQCDYGFTTGHCLRPPIRRKMNCNHRRVGTTEVVPIKHDILPRGNRRFSSSSRPSPPDSAAPDPNSYLVVNGALERPRHSFRLTVDESEKWWRTFHVWLHEGTLELASSALFEARKEGIHEAVIQKAGEELMAAYNQLEMFREVPPIFNFLSIYLTFLNTRGFNLCLESYLIRKAYSKFIDTFKHYTSLPARLQPDHKTYELFIRCLMKLGNITQAREVMKLLEEQRKPVTGTTFAAFLGGVRDKNASLDELETDFEWIKSKKTVLPAALYNIMIEESLAYGKPLVAKEYVDAMIKNGVKPNENTFATFLRLQATVGDWAGVRKALDEVGDRGFVFSKRTLNSILDRYVDMNGLDGLEQFFAILAREEDFPSPASFNIMFRAYLQALDERGVLRWVSYMREAGFKPNATTFNTFFHDLRCSNVPRPLMWRVYNTIFNRNRNMIDEIGRDIRDKSVFPIVKRLAHPVPQDDVPVESIVGNRRTIKEMELALRKGQARNALNVFRNASSYVELSTEVVKLVSRSYILLPDDQIDIPEVMPKTHSRFTAIKEAVISYMIQAARNEAEKEPVAYASIFHVIYGAYKFMEANDIPISHNITYHVAMTLLGGSDSVGALHIMNEVSKTRWGRRTGWDMAGLTVLMRTYTWMWDLQGVRWVVDRILEGRDLPDERLFECMRQSVKTSPSKQYKQDVREQIKRCKAHRDTLWVVAHRRANTVVDVMRD